jgi:hypothetical protein
VADRVVFLLPLIVTDRVLVTANVVTVKVALIDPTGTVTLEGTVARNALLLDRLTAAPAAGAGPFRVTVPVEGVPPLTDVGLRIMADRLGVLTVKEAVRVLLL